jgi:hypothetical protein
MRFLSRDPATQLACGLFSQEKSRILKTEDWLAERGEFELSGDFARDQ